MYRWIWITLSVWVGLGAGGAEANCRQALALGLDVSGSIDAKEYRLQLDGLASALQDPDIVDAFLTMPESPAQLAIYEWSGPAAQRLLLGWTPVTQASDLDEIATRLRRSQRVLTEPTTALGSAKTYGAQLLAQRPNCWRHILDISADGTSNTGPRPQGVRPSGLGINALIIQGAQPDVNAAALDTYFRTYVIQGPAAFIETAQSFDDYQSAMTRKLLRELAVLVLSRNH